MSTPTTALIQTYNATVLTDSGRVSTFGDLNTPVGEASFSFRGVRAAREKVLTGNSWPLFVASVDERYQYVSFRIIGSGTLIVSSKIDKPTNAVAGNFVPLGTQIRWQHEYWTCQMGVWASNTDLVPGLDVAASEQGDTGGTPTLWTSAFFTKKRYRIDLFNPSNTDDIEVEYLVVNPR